MIVKCLKCNVDFDNSGKWGIKKFCSRGCANSRKFTEESKEKTRKTLGTTLGIEFSPSTKKNCKNCGKEFSVPHSRFEKQNCCDAECRKQFQKKESYKKILNGKFKNPKRIKKFLEETVGYVCVLCSNTGTHRGISLTLQLDHIDGNSDNNEISNLRLLCPNCHTQTTTYCRSSKKDKKMDDRNKKFRKWYNELN